MVREATEVGTTHQGAPGSAGAPWWVVLRSEPLSDTSLAQQVSSGLKKFSKKFCCVWTLFGTDILRSKKQEKTTTSTGHYVNRLVPKNDIKFL